VPYDNVSSVHADSKSLYMVIGSICWYW